MFYRIFFLFFILSSPIFSQEIWKLPIENKDEKKRWELEECIERAIKKNISIKQSGLDLEDSKNYKKEALFSFSPKINLGGSHVWNYGLSQNIVTGFLDKTENQSSSLNISANIDIYKGMLNFKRFQASNLSIQSNEYRLKNIKEDIALLVANSYLQILFNKENLGIKNSQLNIATQELNIAEEKLKNGIIPKGELYELEASVAMAEQSLVVAENNYRLSKISLANLLLIPKTEVFKISDKEYKIPSSDILNISPKEIYNKAINYRNEIKLAETNLLIARKNIEISKSSFQPSIIGFYSYDSRFLSQSNLSIEEQIELNAGNSFGLQLSIPIFNGWRNNVDVKQKKIAVLKSINNLNQAKLDLENTINEALNDAKGSYKTYEAAKKTLIARETAFKYAQDRFDIGAINTFNFLQAQERYTTAQSEVVKTKYDYIFKVKILEFYMSNSILSF